MRRPWRVAAGLGSVLVLWVAGPRLLRHVAFFRVRQIELVGVRYHAPATVLGVLRLGSHASVFDDRDDIVARVRALPGVADARIARRLPGVLRVIIREVEPVALVPGADGGPLTVVDGDGHPLPYDPSRTPLDLPIAASADSGLISVLARIQAVDPTLFTTISTARSGRRDIVLELGSRRVLVRRDVDLNVIQAVVQVTRDLASRSRRYAELDARYAGWVVVRGTSGGGA
jgi:cell division septal protein FtsQ